MLNPSTPQSAAAPTSSARKSERLMHVDSVRGALLVLMAINHIPSDLTPITNHFFGYVSGAEGFVFLSGLMCGFVYTKRYFKHGAAALKEAAVKRARTTYLYHVVTFVAVLVGLLAYRAIYDANAPTATSILMDHPWAALLSSLTLLQQPMLFDILPLYCVFLVLLPYILILCSRGHRATLLLASVSLWLLVNVFSPQQPLINGLVNTGSFNLLAWQMLFVFGAVFGHAWASGQRLIIPPTRWVIALVLIPAVFLYCVRHAYISLPTPRAWLDWSTNKNNLAPLRAFNAALIFYLVYAVSVHAPKWLTSRALAFLGEHSIFVFAAHIFVAYIILSFPDVFQMDAESRAMATVMMVGSLFVAAAIHRAMQARALQARQATPASVSVG